MIAAEIIFGILAGNLALGMFFGAFAKKGRQ